MVTPDREKLRQRLKLGESDFQWLWAVIELYEPTINIRNLGTGELVLFDQKNRTIGFRRATLTGRGSYTLTAPTTENVVLYTDQMILGWIKASSLLDGNLAPKEALSPLPEDFDFKVTCPHLSVHGGISLDNLTWECLGCGAKLVFNDKKR